MSRILLVEDDTALALGLLKSLEHDTRQVEHVASAEEAQKIISTAQYDLCIVDINLPGSDGFSLCKWIKRQSDMAVIFLTARDLDADQERGFDLGADDYITKPFNVSLLQKRVDAVLRRTSGASFSDVFNDGHLLIDFDKAQAEVDGALVQLTPTEYQLLSLFISHAGKVLTRQVLLADIWDRNEDFVEEHTLTVHMNRLRGKIEDEKHKYIKTVYGMGYMWVGGKMHG